MADMQFYVLLNIISVISGQWAVDNEIKAVRNGTPFMVQKILPEAEIDLRPLDQ